MRKRPERGLSSVVSYSYGAHSGWIGGRGGGVYPSSRHSGEDESHMPWVQDWAASAACKNESPDTLFVQGAAQNRVKTMCLGCPVRTECLADALDNRVEFGVWGGLTERERRALLRRRPGVQSWRTLLRAAMDEFEHSDTRQPVGATG